MDAVFYLLDALRLFRGKSLQEIREITFEIGMLGRYGLDINDPLVQPRPAIAAGEALLRAGAGVHHVRRLQEDRAGDGYRGGSGGGVEMAERLAREFGRNG
jgi:hypothetical protein